MAETEDQLYNTCLEIKKLNINFLRVGTWKPRSRPNGFEGVGEEALVWISRMKKKLDINVAIEVGSTDHVEMALKYGIDIFWLGARTVANPFVVKSIADTLEGVDIPVLIKNPINPDLNLWIGAIERIHKAGIKRIGAIHRGFSTHVKGLYRNQPIWDIAINLKKHMPTIPLFLDPSHISGKRSLIFDVIEKSLIANYDGYFIECHINPEVALSDSAQQVTPLTLKKIRNKIEEVNNAKSINTICLEDLRNKIDNIDEEILFYLRMRMEIVAEIGRYKKMNGMDIFQQKRWKDILNSRTESAKKHNLSQLFIEDLFNSIHKECMKLQMDS